MEFWNSLLTEKSFVLLKELNKKPFKFILIGGWAAYFWTRQHKSKDIDIVIPNFEDLEYLKKEYGLKKNDSLKKYEIQWEEIDVDIYVPYYSQLIIPLEELKDQTTKIEGIQVVRPEALLILKQGAEKEREYSVKGQKDRIDIMALLVFSGINFRQYHQLLKKYRLEYFSDRLKSIVHHFTDIKYLNLNPRKFKLKKKELLKQI